MKKIVSLLLSLMLVFLATAAVAETAITVSRGSTMSMDVSVSGATGKYALIGIETYDAPVTFKSAVGGDVNDTVPPKAFNDYFAVVNADGLTILPDGSDFSGSVGDYTMNVLEDGVIGTVTFTVNADAAVGTYTVEAVKKQGSCTVSGSVTFTVVDRVPGDANDDGVIDVMDALIIMQMLAGYDVAINEANANCNGDSAIDVMDALRIMQYLAGYDVVPE